MSKRTIVVVPALVVVMLLLGGAQVTAQRPGGAVPQVALGPGFTYQGQLKDSAGNPIGNSCDFRFSLWDDLTAGTQVGSDSTVTGVQVTNGYFAALVNGGGEFGPTAFSGEARWLEIEVQCAGDPSYTTLSPRQALTAAPYALYALAVGPHEHWGEAWSGSGVGLTLSGGQTGLSGSGAAQGVYGLASASFGTTYGVYGESYSADGRGVYGLSSATSGTAYGVYGESDSTSGRGVYGYASATSGEAYGVVGASYSTSGMGVFGLALRDGGTNYGVVGQSESIDGRGVAGFAVASFGTTYGVYGESSSTSGRGVYGLATAASGTTYGVYGESSSTNGRGVYGLATTTTYYAWGVFGRSASTWGRGVEGQATATSGTTYGVRGLSYSSSGYGVYGAAADSNVNYGVYSFGNFAATGAKAAIVQTRDYAWRHLYALESPEVLFEDVGTAQLLNGQAVVAIEPIFAQTVNLESPYQVFLTPLSEEAVLLYLAAKTGTGFSVRGVTLDGRPANCSFDYRIIARRLGYEQIRLAPADDPALAARSPGLEVEP